MRTGERFWQLVAVVVMILLGYALTALYDFNQVQQKQLLSQQQLLVKQQLLLKDNHWQRDVKETEKIRQAWLAYLPTERSQTSAKAKLLSDIRNLAQNAGIPNATISASDAETGDSGKAGNPFSADKPELQAKPSAKSQTLPAQVQMIKLSINGRFDPIPFRHLLNKITTDLPFTVIDSVRVRGSQLEVGVRCYWRIDMQDGKTRPAGTEAAKES